MIRHRPLSIQIWLIFGLTMVLSLLLISLVPWALSDLLEPGLNMAIDRIQLSVLEMYNNQEITLDELPFAETVTHPIISTTLSHIVLHGDGSYLSTTRLPLTVMAEIGSQADSLDDGDFTAHAGRIESANLFYLIRRIDTGAEEAFIITYGWDFYRDEMVKGLFYRFMIIIGLILLICLIPALLLARYISKPLVQLESHVRQIADRNWHQPIRVKRGDEIGNLAASIEKMRQRLIQQDKAQQSFLQNISHELKTPVMVIRSYAQSISDGIFPQGDLASTIKVIDEESERLEKRIQDLLYLTKIDYLSTHEPVNDAADLSEVLHDVIGRLSRRRSEVQWSTDLPSLMVPGASEQWTVVFENLLDNQIRYAAGQIAVFLERKQNEAGNLSALVRLWNDGPPIDDPVMGKLFQKFNHGPGGQFGLGLAIVQRLVHLYSGRIWAANEDGGVAFYLEIPASKTHSTGQEGLK
jgi:two-component system, OmpR family, sensor histidine kinase CssS